MSNEEERQIAIRLSSNDPAYQIPPAKYMVPVSWRRYQLSELINKVLEHSTPVPFDFLISSTLLRTSLEEYCKSTGVSEEITLEIEYLPSTLPPKLESSLPSDDWVSDVQISANGDILSASYSGIITLTQFSRNTINFSGHTLSTLSACLLPSFSIKPEKSYLASAGMDRIARVWEYDSNGHDTQYLLPFHTAPISSIRSRKAESEPPHLLTAGWDGMVGVWDLTPGKYEQGGDAIDATERKKKRRKANTETIKKNPLHALSGHIGKVSNAIFDSSDITRAFSAGLDHTLRVWNLELGIQADTKTSDLAHLALAQLNSPNLLASGSMSRTVSVFDLRSTTHNISLSLPGHTAPVSSVAAHATKPEALLSGGYDGTVRIWDVRSVKQALFVLPMPAEGSVDPTKQKVLTVDWNTEKIVAGGENKKVVVWNINDGAAPTRT